MNRNTGPSRSSWDELTSKEELRGRWVALDNVLYAPSKEPLEADLVDFDDDLTALCGRMRAADQTSCKILRCVARNSQRQSPPPSRPPPSGVVPRVTARSA